MSDPFAFSSSKMTLIGLGISESGYILYRLFINSQLLTETNVIKVMDFNGIQCFYANANSLPNKLGELMTRHWFLLKLDCLQCFWNVLLLLLDLYHPPVSGGPFTRYLYFIDWLFSSNTSILFLFTHD
jgi:hypothetical protein